MARKTAETPLPEHPRDVARRKAALADLRRAEESGEIVGTSALKRAAERARDHMTAADADPDDAIEVLGKRIGRALSLIAVIVLVVYLAWTYL